MGKNEKTFKEWYDENLKIRMQIFSGAGCALHVKIIKPTKNVINNHL